MDGIAATTLITGASQPSKVLILTTFDVDQYVFAGLRAGASGFLLKDAPPPELVAAIRTVAGGEAVLAPTATRRLIGQFLPLLPDPGQRPGQGGEQERAALLAALTDRERTVFAQLAAGRSNREIAGVLHLSEGTVKIHVGRILAKLGLRDRVQAVILAYESGLITPGG
jgi:DNA-binding NarL/FixJ family response regulator